MKASLDTNAIIHFYRAGLQNLLFELFNDGLMIYEQIRTVELNNHGQDVLMQVDADIAEGKIVVYTEVSLKEIGAWSLFQSKVADNRPLYQKGDLGEVYAISLAQTLGGYSLVTDDTKNGGPYKSLLQFWDWDVMPLNFVDVLLLLYLKGVINESECIDRFTMINAMLSPQWSLKGKIREFVNRFNKDPYHEEEKIWLSDYCRKYNVVLSVKMKNLVSAIMMEKNTGQSNEVLVLSTGMGNTEPVPRVYNVPEIVTVDILPE